MLIVVNGLFEGNQILGISLGFMSGT